MSNILTNAGWQQTDPVHKNAGETFILKQAGGARLILEERDDHLLLWIEDGKRERRVLKVEPGEKGEAFLHKLVQEQADMNVQSYMTKYFVLQEACEVSVLMWEQFAGLSDPPVKAITDDEVVFPNGPVKRLTDYVGMMKMMSTGDMAGAMGKYGLDMAGYAQVAMAWGQKLAADPTLSARFGQMMMA